jgi:hypothetical protein
LDKATVDEMLVRSDALGAALVEHLGASAAEEREMAALQLQAAAAVDIDRANALAAIADGEPPEAALSSDRWDSIDRILSTSTELGIVAVLETNGNGFLATAGEPGTLKDAVNAAVDSIADDAEKAAATTVKGLTGIPSADIIKGLNDGVDKVFEDLGDKVKWLKRKAVELVLKAVKKLLAVFGTSTEAARKKVEDWIGDLDEDKVEGLLQRLYGIDQRKEHYGSQIDGVSGGVPEQRDKAARDELAILQAKWHKRTEMIDTIGGIAPYARQWIWGLAPPWGGLAYCTAFALATGYVVFAGGDYLDWREDDGILDVVEGTGGIVDRAVAANA